MKTSFLFRPAFLCLFPITAVSSCVGSPWGRKLANGSAQAEECQTPILFEAEAAAIAKPVIYVVMSTTTGEFFADLQEGAQLQAAGIGPNGVDIIVSDAKGDDLVQAELVRAASSNPDTVGILTVDGSNTTMCVAIQSAIEVGLPVVSFDFIGDPCMPENHILASQFDTEIASLVLEEALNDLGTNLTVGYVSDLNYNPLIRRNTVWEKYKSQNNWNQVFFVNNAANYSSAEALQDAIEGAIKGIPEKIEIDFIYSPWDYLAQNTLLALNATTLKTENTSVYGADINTADIQAMTKAGSEWKATAGASSNAIGALLTRLVALAAANQTSEIETDTTSSGQVKIPSTLITQTFLRDNTILNMDALEGAKPELALEDLMTACWICSSFRNPWNGTNNDNDNTDPPVSDNSSSGSNHNHHAGHYFITSTTGVIVSLILTTTMHW